MLYIDDKDRQLQLRKAALAWEAEIAAARPLAGDRIPYPEATRRALRAWDHALGQSFERASEAVR